MVGNINAKLFFIFQIILRKVGWSSSRNTESNIHSFQELGQFCVSLQTPHDVDGETAVRAPSDSLLHCGFYWWIFHLGKLQ